MMEHSERLRRAVLLAIEAGDVAAAATRRIAGGNSDPNDTGTGLRGLIVRASRFSSGPAVTALQVERTCENVDDFTTTIHDVNGLVTSDEEQIDTSHEWRARLEESYRAAADIHNEVTATLALLGRYRTNIVLGRPLLDHSESRDEARVAGGSDMDPVEMHTRAQSVFESVLEHVTEDDLDRPTPCDDWSVVDLIAHVAEGNQLVADRVGDGSAPLPGGDRLTVHRASAEQARSAFAQPGWQERSVELPFGSVPAPVYANIRSGDLYGHSWDLATAIGVDTDLDRELGEAVLAATAPLLSADLRGEGRPFAAEQPCDQDRPIADRLAAFFGRAVPRHS